jgi:hypothetical protein
VSNGNGTRAAPLARNDYREGQILRARDLERESGYFLARDRQHAALAHIPGILHGLRLNVFEQGTDTVVTPEDLANAGSRPLDLFVESGVAVDAYGRLVGLPRREQVGTELATSPSVLRAGLYRVVLLYDRSAEGAAAGNGDPCAGLSAAQGGGGTVRERGILRLRDADEPLPDPPTPGELVEGPSDRPEDEAPVVLGTVLWNGEDAFVGFSASERRYAGVTAHTMASPDQRARVELRDEAGRLAVRVAPEAPVGQAPQFGDVLRVDPEGGVWMRAGVDAGPDGVRLRRDRNGQEVSQWRLHLHSQPDPPGSAIFGRDPKGDPSTPPAYHPGEQELRLVFEGTGDGLGRRRVVIGHMDPRTNEFRPSLIVYDKRPSAPDKGTSTVEVFGDFYVRGTAHLSGVQRITREEEDESEELNMLLLQLAGPFAGAFRTFLKSDPKWLGELAGAVASHIPTNDAFITAVTKSLAGNAGFVSGIAGAATPGIRSTLAGDTEFRNQLREAVSAQLKADIPFIGALADAVANLLDDRGTFITQIVNVLLARQDFTDAVTAKVKPAVTGDTEFRGQVAAQVKSAVTADTEFRAQLTTQVKSAVTADEVFRGQVAGQVRSAITADEAFRGQLADLAVSRITQNETNTANLAAKVAQWLDQSSTAQQVTAINGILDALAERLLQDGTRRVNMRNALGIQEGPLPEPDPVPAPKPTPDPLPAPLPPEK